MPTTKKEYRGRPSIVLPQSKAVKALYLLAQRVSFQQVADDIGVKRRWLSDAYKDGRLRDLAGRRAGGEILRPFSIFANLVENSSEDEQW